MSACELCGSTSIDVLHVSAQTGQHIGRCRSCRLVTVLDAVSTASFEEMYNSTEGYQRYIDAQRVEGLKKRHLHTIDRLTDLLPSMEADSTIFDVGAGAGGFLSLAQAAGFQVHGNEISKPAADECFRRHGITLSMTGLAEEPGEGRFDAVTMWCVLAHVPDPHRLLADAFRLLKPDGILYFHTPRWCAIDRAGLVALRLSSGRLFHVTERRVNAAHMRLYDRRNLSRVLHKVGFEIRELRAVAGYSLRASAYLGSLAVPGALIRPLASGIEALIDRNLCVRNTLDVYARKPA